MRQVDEISMFPLAEVSVALKRRFTWGLHSGPVNDLVCKPTRKVICKSSSAHGLCHGDMPNNDFSLPLTLLHLQVAIPPRADLQLSVQSPQQPCKPCPP